MTFDQAFMYLLHHPEGPFPDEVWEHISYMYESQDSLTVNARETDSGNRRKGLHPEDGGGVGGVIG